MKPIEAFTFLEDVGEFFNVLDYAFQFPYFGFNWDALLDCLSDLDWIAEEPVVIIHREMPRLPEAGLKIYLGVLCSALGRLRNYNEPNRLKVVFKESDRERVLHLLSQIEFVA